MRAQNSFYGRMARLGVVEANAQAKKYDKAISAAQALVNNTSDDTIPRDALLMELGRVQAAAGKKAEAKQTLDKVIAEFPESPTSKRRSGCWRSSRRRRSTGQTKIEMLGLLSSSCFVNWYVRIL